MPGLAITDLGTPPLGDPQPANEPRTPSDGEMRARIRKELPASTLRRKPWRLAWAAPHVGVVVAGTWAVGWLTLPWVANLALGILVGNSYAALMFFGHEVAHGSVLRSRRAQDLVLGLCGLIFLISPRLWRSWHNALHHGHPNVPDRDPDNFGDLEAYNQASGARAFLKLAPGSGSWLSAPYLFIFFTIQTQNVLWRKTTDPLFSPTLKRRAIAVTLCMLAFWVALGVMLGPGGALFGVLVPMAVANFVLLAYITTNHMLSPAGPGRDTLEVTMSVSTWKWVDCMHFHFSHHVEHHLFPSLGSDAYPAVRRWLREHASDQYLAPPHLTALRTLFHTPRLYDQRHHLVDPERGRRVALSTVAQVLRGELPLSELRTNRG